MRISDWSSDVCSSDLIMDGALRYDFGRIAVGPIELGSLSLGARANRVNVVALAALAGEYDAIQARHEAQGDQNLVLSKEEENALRDKLIAVLASEPSVAIEPLVWKNDDGQSNARSEEHKSELQSLMRITDAVFCLK